MSLLFKKKRKKLEQIKATEEVIVATHKKNIAKIRKSREKADKLVAVLEENGLILKLASVMGH